MIPIQLSSVKERIDLYLASDNPYPYFVSVDGSDEYSSIIGEYAGCRKIRMSSYCEQRDSFPNVDKLYSDLLQRLDGNCFLLGIGESISLGDRGSISFLGRIKDLTLPYKLVVLCRGIKDIIRKIDESDRKFNERRFSVVASTVDYSVIRLADGIPFLATKSRPILKEGFRDLLAHLEQGKAGVVVTRSALPLKNVKEIRSCYMLLSEDGKVTQVKESALSEDCWRSYLKDGSLDDCGLFDWRTYLKMLLYGADSPYLRFVISVSDDYGAYRRMLTEALLLLDRGDDRFRDYYDERKKILENEAAEAEMLIFVAEAKRHGGNRIYYLTDNTRAERHAIVEDIAKYGAIPDCIELIYPALAGYLSGYRFDCSNGDLFTDYFSEYKRQKLLNEIKPAFLERVVDLSQDGNRAYNVLESRNSVVEQAFAPDAHLCWIDALGVEYLGYIQWRAHSLGLSMSTRITRASLPTLTALNKGFYEDWAGGKHKEEGLDDIKHDGEEGPESKAGKLPTYIVRELEIIDQVLMSAQQHLVNRDYRRFVLASDHGASRLAVIRDCDNKWEMQSKGQHSGRCCPVNEIDERPTCATEENGYWVLANYDRFKGSRKAYVEVHGGAALEEVIVPVVELSLKDASVRVECLTDIAYSSFKERPIIELFSASSLKNLSVRLNGKSYHARATEEDRYEVCFEDLSKIGAYSAEVYEGDDLIGEIAFRVQKRTAKTNDDDWFD